MLRDLVEIKENFLKDLAAKNNYNDNQIIFMDEFELDLAFSNSPRSRKKGRSTLILSLTKSGKFLQPKTILCYKKAATKSIEEFMVFGTTSLSAPDISTLLDWTQKILLEYTKGTQVLLILDSWSNHKAKKFRMLLDLNRVEVLEVPLGLNCALNPLKEIIKYLQEITAKKISSLKDRKGKTLRLNELSQWIETGINDIAINRRDLVASSFNCFKLDKL